jgi:hypothetical protein
VYVYPFTTAALAAVMIAVLTGLALGQSGSQSPSLDMTIAYMSDLLTNEGKDQTILWGKNYRADACRLFISDDIIDNTVKPAKTYKTEVQFHLMWVDPQTIKVDTQHATIPVVRFETTNYQVRFGKVPLSGRKLMVRKGSNLISFPHYLFYLFKFYNTIAAEHFAKAFRHAVELCGGKPSAF